MSDITDFYRRPSLTSDLGRHHELVPRLPTGAGALGTIVRGLLIHNVAAKIRGLPLSAERMSHMQAVGAEAILDNVISLDPGPLGIKRPAGRRMVGFCYHFALLHCALLRATGTPARARCGFAGYFEARRWIDHWVVEYWEGRGLRLVLVRPDQGGPPRPTARRTRRVTRPSLSSCGDRRVGRGHTGVL